MFHIPILQPISAINRYRVRLGASYPIGDQHKIKLFGAPQWNYPDRTVKVVFSLGYSFDFKSK